MPGGSLANARFDGGAGLGRIECPGQDENGVARLIVLVVTRLNLFACHGRENVRAIPPSAPLRGGPNELTRLVDHAEGRDPAKHVGHFGEESRPLPFEIGVGQTELPIRAAASRNSSSELGLAGKTVATMV